MATIREQVEEQRQKFREAKQELIEKRESLIKPTTKRIKLIPRKIREAKRQLLQNIGKAEEELKKQEYKFEEEAKPLIEAEIIEEKEIARIQAEKAKAKKELSEWKIARKFFEEKRSPAALKGSGAYSKYKKLRKIEEYYKGEKFGTYTGEVVEQLSPTSKKTTYYHGGIPFTAIIETEGKKPILRPYAPVLEKGLKELKLRFPKKEVKITPKEIITTRTEKIFPDLFLKKPEEFDFEEYVKSYRRSLPSLEEMPTGEIKEIIEKPFFERVIESGEVKKATTIPSISQKFATGIVRTSLDIAREKLEKRKAELEQRGKKETKGAGLFGLGVLSGILGTAESIARPKETITGIIESSKVLLTEKEKREEAKKKLAREFRVAPEFAIGEIAAYLAPGLVTKRSKLIKEIKGIEKDVIPVYIKGEQKILKDKLIGTDVEFLIGKRTKEPIKFFEKPATMAKEIGEAKAIAIQKGKEARAITFGRAVEKGVIEVLPSGKIGFPKMRTFLGFEELKMTPAQWREISKFIPEIKSIREIPRAELRLMKPSIREPAIKFRPEIKDIEIAGRNIKGMVQVSKGKVLVTPEEYLIKSKLKKVKIKPEDFITIARRIPEKELSFIIRSTIKEISKIDADKIVKILKGKIGLPLKETKKFKSLINKIIPKIKKTKYKLFSRLSLNTQELIKLILSETKLVPSKKISLDDFVTFSNVLTDKDISIIVGQTLTRSGDRILFKAIIKGLKGTEDKFFRLSRNQKINFAKALDQVIGTITAEAAQKQKISKLGPMAQAIINYFDNAGKIESIAAPISAVSKKEEILSIMQEPEDFIYSATKKPEIKIGMQKVVEKPIISIEEAFSSLQKGLIGIREKEKIRQKGVERLKQSELEKQKQIEMIKQKEIEKMRQKQIFAEFGTFQIPGISFAPLIPKIKIPKKISETEIEKRLKKKIELEKKKRKFIPAPTGIDILTENLISKRPKFAITGFEISRLI